ncbi:MAG: methyltransferase [Rickettsiales bacterium]|nr:methyltransferase [Rickettsiales bacterium]
MTVYFSTFIAGFGGLVLDLMKRDRGSARNIRLFDGAVVYESDSRPEDMEKIGYFNNSFIVLREFGYGTGFGREILDRMVADLVSDSRNLSIPFFPMKSFKIFSSLENTLAKPDGKLIYRLVELIKGKTGKNYGSSSANGEFWIIQRSEGVGFFMLRVTYSRKKLEKGELRPELANLLCRLSEPEEDDIFIDPFCGSGAIPLERSKMLSFKGIFATDRDESLTNGLRNKVRKIKTSKMQRSFFVKKLDFFSNSFDNNFFDVMVTDPPWGIYQELEEGFYPRFLGEASRILEPNGRLVLLTAREICLGEGPRIGSLTLERHFDILVSGKKARVHLLAKE